MDEAKQDQGHTVSYAGKNWRMAPGETVLESLLRGGAEPAFSCRKGTCQVCIMELVSGDPGPEANALLSESQRAAGLILPCKTRPRSDLELEIPDPSKVLAPVHVIGREHLAPGIVRLRLTPEGELSWRAGQHLRVEHPSGAQRAYSIASLHEEREDIELHVRLHPGGHVSPWLCEEVGLGTVLKVRAPTGDCVYEFSEEQADRELLLVAGGTGLAPLVAIARDALRRGHRGPIRLYHGAATSAGLYLHDELMTLAEGFPTLHYQAWADTSEPGTSLPPGVQIGRVVDAALGAAAGDRSDVTLYVAGPPAMIYAARHLAVLAGVSRAEIHTDPFETSAPYMPDDAAKVAQIEAEPELWAALEEGAGLTAILADFYEHVFVDPQLAPFFVKISKSRVREKQYEFLSELFTGHRHYLGARPFNAHHEMVISDSLFDHREEMLEAAMHRYGLAEPLIRRWLAVHELFRAEIVKTSPRGLVIEGVEQILEGYSEERLELATLCDRCMAELEVGAVARLHRLTGELYCSACWASE